MASRLALSFGGSGHLLAYQLGVARSVLSHRIFRENVVKFGGSSGGAIVASLLSCLGAESIDKFFDNHASKCKSLTGILESLPEGAHLTANSRLYVSVTDCNTGDNKVLDKFLDRRQLGQTIQASCHIPPSFHPFDMLRSRAIYPLSEGKAITHLPGSTYCDGGISRSIPAIPDVDLTVTVSPIAGPREQIGDRGELEGLAVAHVCPERSGLRLGSVGIAGQRADISAANLKRLSKAFTGSSPEDMRALFEDGIRDGDLFVKDYERSCGFGTGGLS
ncbi:hypothetical protein AAMO2058_000901600 [Amorphochlora amoebiformis]